MLTFCGCAGIVALSNTDGDNLLWLFAHRNWQQSWQHTRSRHVRIDMVAAEQGNFTANNVAESKSLAQSGALIRELCRFAPPL